MEKFVIHCSEGDSIVVTAKTAKAAAKIASENGKNIMKYNNQSSLYFIWDENEENILYTIHTFKCMNKVVTKITKGDEN